MRWPFAGPRVISALLPLRRRDAVYAPRLLMQETTYLELLHCLLHRTTYFQNWSCVFRTVLDSFVNCVRMSRESCVCHTRHMT